MNARRVAMLMPGALLIAIVPMIVLAQTTQPTTAPSTRPSEPPRTANELLDDLLAPTGDEGPRPVAPVERPTIDLTTPQSVAPGDVAEKLLREGTLVIDRMGRLFYDEQQNDWLFVYESDGRGMSDPPMVLIPNLKLMTMELQAETADGSPLFRVTGTVTEYKGRNHLMLEKWVLVSERESDL